MNISKFVSPEIIFGREALKQLGECALRLGATKVLVVTDPGVIEAGWVDRVTTHLKDSGLDCLVWCGLTSNPKDFEIHQGVQFYLEAQCDALVAVGGGTPIDAAKAIAILATNGGKIADYEGVDRIHQPLPPMIVASSTAGSGAEVSQFSVIVDTHRKIKMTIISRSLIPDIAIIDPLLLMTKNPQLTANTGMDALTHAIEAYLSVAATPLTDIQALSAIRLIANNLRQSVASKVDLAAKEAMAMASLQAGLAFSNAILGAVHAMTHQLGGLLDMPHGEANAILLPYVMDFNFIAAIDKYIDIAHAFGEPLQGLSKRDAGQRAIVAVRQLADDIGIPKRLSEVGLQENVIPQLSINAYRDACLITNPRDASIADLEVIFRKAL